MIMTAYCLNNTGHGSIDASVIFLLGVKDYKGKIYLCSSAEANFSLSVIVFK